MRADWTPVRFHPKEPGAYLVTTAHGKVMIDRWNGEWWGRCVPRQSVSDRGFGRFPLHKAWTPLPPGYKEIEE